MKSTPQRKFVIRPLRDPPKLPADYEEKNWAVVAQAAEAVMGCNANSSFSSEKICRTVEALCNLGIEAKMYSYLFELLQRCVADRTGHLATRASGGCTLCLSATVKIWSEFSSSITRLMHLFIHLDRRYVLQKTRERSFRDLGIRLFGESLLQNESLLNAVQDGFLARVTEERNGNFVDRTELSLCRDMMMSIQIYFTVFESRLYASTTTFYQVEGERLLAQGLAAPLYYQNAKQRLQQERERVAVYLHTRTRPLMEEAVQSCLLKPFLPTLLQSGLSQMIADQLFDDLKLCYQLCSMRHVQCGEALRLKFKEYIIQRGDLLCHPKNLDDSVIRSLIQLLEDSEKIVAVSFMQASSFELAVREGFEFFLRRSQQKVAELLARFVDSHLKEGSKKATDEEVETVLNSVLKIFNLIPSKDIFEAFYARDFAKRLILQRCSSIDLEKYVIAKLRCICGPSLATKLEGMMRDIDLSRDLNLLFQEARQLSSGREPDEVDINVFVLTQGYWPTYPALDPVLPDALSRQIALFTKFYSTKHSSRKLTWLPSLSYCTVRGNFPRGRKELGVSFIQALILRLYNTSDVLAFRDIQQQLHLEGPELISAMLSLSVGGVKILLRTSKSTSSIIHLDEQFTFNSQFSHRLVRVRINQVQMRETREEADETMEKVVAERQYVVDAAIVRFMKARKTVQHSELITEVSRLVRFPVGAADIKKRIEVLIDREYLSRRDTDASVYEYRA